MAVWSSLAYKKVSNLNFFRTARAFLRHDLGLKAASDVPVRNCHERRLQIKTSYMQYFKFKDLLFFYLTIGALPLLALITYVNLFIGPAQLALIPEGYEPEPYEYHRHPITRFLAKYVTKSPQERYERNLHTCFYNYEHRCVRALKNKIVNLIKEREDYQSWYYDYNAIVKYARFMNKTSKEAEENRSTAGGWIQ